MTITMELAEYEQLKAEAAKPDKGMAELERWNKFLDQLDEPNAFDELQKRISDGEKLGSAIFSMYKPFTQTA